MVENKIVHSKIILPIAALTSVVIELSEICNQLLI